jgi:hypothetical protein
LLAVLSFVLLSIFFVVVVFVSIAQVFQTSREQIQCALKNKRNNRQREWRDIYSIFSMLCACAINDI